MKKISLLVGGIIGFMSFFNAQTPGLFLDGAQVYVQNNASLTIEGSLEAENNSFVKNEGNVSIRDNVVNNSGSVLFINETAGTVELYGNDQLVTGTDSILFYNLYFEGNNGARKSVVVAASVVNELDINNQVLETIDNRVYLLNPDPSALFFDNGFIQAQNLGSYFVRYTNSQNEYVFPVGSSLYSPNLRPVVITPESNDESVFEVRFSEIGAHLDNSGTSATGAAGPFDKNAKQPSLLEINEAFYHTIHLLEGNTPAKIEVFYSTQDGDFATLAQWKNDEYAFVGFVNEAENFLGLDQKMVISNFSNYQDDIFSLSSLSPDIKVPNGISVNGDGLNDVLVIDNIDLYPNHNLSIFNRWGDLVFDASPYENNWEGQSNQSGGGDKKLVPGTYFYVLELGEGFEPIKGFVELKR